MAKKNSYKLPMKKLILAQFGAAILGLMMNLPTSTLTNSKLLDLITSIIAILFFLYIQFTAMWDIGAKDKIAIDGGRMDEDPLYGFKAAFMANIPNYILAFVCVSAKALFVLSDILWAESASFMTYLVSLLWNGMYIGVLECLVPPQNDGLLSVAYMCLFFVITIPSLLTCFFAYRMGLKGTRIFPEKKKN